MRLSRPVSIAYIAMGLASAIVAPVDAWSAASGKGTATAITKNRETHRLLTESPPDWVQLLLSQGADIEARSIDRQTPLITCAGQGDLRLVELLLHNHADIHAADADGNTALHAASFNSRVKVVELLLNHGAQTRVQNRLGFSPLHQAVRRFWEVPGETPASRAENQRHIVLLLLAHGADPSIEDLSHRTAAVLATESNNPQLAGLFDVRSIGGRPQASIPSPAASHPHQEAPADAPPQHEPEVRQHIERAPDQEHPREADAAKPDPITNEPQPVPLSPESEMEITARPDGKSMDTAPPPAESDSSITAAGTAEPPPPSTSKPADPPPASGENAGQPEAMSVPSAPSPPSRDVAAVEPAPMERREALLPSTPPRQEGPPAEPSGSERQQRSESTSQTVPETRPQPSLALPAPASEVEIPHTKAMPELPKRKRTEVREAPPARDKPAPSVSQSDIPPAPPQAATSPAPMHPQGIGSVAQAPNSGGTAPKSVPDIQPSQPGPPTPPSIKDLTQAGNGQKDHDRPPEESSNNWILRNLGFGIGVGWTHNLGPQRIESATAVNRVVRVNEDQNDLIRFMPEVHLWVDQWDDQRWSWGPFLAVAPGSHFIDAVGFGLMLGYRSHQADRYTFNLGIGGTLDFDTRVLGDGLAANQPLPPGENQVRTKQTTAPGLLIMLSVGWDMGTPRRAPPPP